MNMREKLKELAHEKDEKRVTYPVRQLPDVRTLVNMTFLGSYSFTIPELKTRYALDSVVIRPFGVYQTPTEISRAYLGVKYPTKVRQFHSQYIANSFHRGWPYLAKPGRYGDCVYIDLKSAYWSIMQLVGWDAEYNPGRWLGRRSIMTDFPLPENRLARNSLVSSSLLSSVSVWTGSKLTTKQTGNKNYNPVVSSIVQDVLHGIASDMENLGAVYVHTDGYILPSYLERPALRLINEGWGMPARVKHRGWGMVRGVGAYAVGEHVSKRLPTTTAETARNIIPRSKAWLRTTMASRRERTQLYFGDDSGFSDSRYDEWIEWDGRP